MGDDLLVGGIQSTGGAAVGDDAIYTSKYLAIATGMITSIKFWSYASGHAKVAIYTDNGSDYPATLLAQSGESDIVSGALNSIPMSETEVSIGAAYWLAIISDCLNCFKVVGDTSLRKAVAYTGFVYPDPAGAGYESRAYGIAIAAYGALASGGAGRRIGSKSRLIGGPSPLIGGPSPLIG